MNHRATVLTLLLCLAATHAALAASTSTDALLREARQCVDEAFYGIAVENVQAVLEREPSNAEALALREALLNNADARPYVQMQRRCTLSLTQTPLATALESLRSQTGVNMNVNWAAMEAAGVTPQTPVTVQATDVKADALLKLVLDTAAQAGVGEPLSFTINERMLFVSTTSNANQFTEIRIYDVSDLLPNTPIEDRTDPDAWEREVIREECTAQYMDLIMNTVGRPEDWEFYGGTVSSLVEMNGRFIVRTTAAQHMELMMLLREIRSATFNRIRFETRAILVTDAMLRQLQLEPPAAGRATEPKKPAAHIIDAARINAIATAAQTGLIITHDLPAVTVFNNGKGVAEKVRRVHRSGGEPSGDGIIVAGVRVTLEPFADLGSDDSIRLRLTARLFTPAPAAAVQQGDLAVDEMEVSSDAIIAEGQSLLIPLARTRARDLSDTTPPPAKGEERIIAVIVTPVFVGN